MIIELENDVVQEFTATLDGVELVFRIDWNERASTWFIGVFDTLDTPILTTIKLQVGTPLFVYNKSKLPPGVLTLVRIDGENTLPTKESLNKYFLHYMTPDEFEADLTEALS